MKTIDIGSVKIPLDSYVVGGTALLGIRESGKTFAAKGIAEQLLDYHIPIVVFDAIGVWRFLKVSRPSAGGKGFKIVVAGGEGADLPLTPGSAQAIVRAAMAENIPLVIDLYDAKLSKADWRRIVQTCFRTLLYENKGLRHIFLEETAEYAPQRVTDGETYAEVEKLVRMGGNRSLGITLINQRAQEVNKAVLDLCENLVLMRQRGAHAIEALEKWIDKLEPDVGKRIAAEMPRMAQGDAWVFSGSADTAKRVHTDLIRSYHPDRRKPDAKTTSAARTADAADFVARLSGELGKLIEDAKANDPAELRRQLAAARRQLDVVQSRPPPTMTPADRLQIEADAEARGYREGRISALKDAETVMLDAMRQSISKEHDFSTKETAQVAVQRTHNARVKTPVITREKPGSNRLLTPKQMDAHLAKNMPKNPDAVTGLKLKILKAIAWLRDKGIDKPSRQTVAAVAGAVSTGGYFVKMLGEMRTAGMVEYPEAGTIVATPSYQLDADGVDGEVSDQWLKILSGLEREIVAKLIEVHPAAVTRDELGRMLGKAADGGYFVKMLGQLRTLGAIDYPCAGAVALTRYVMP